MNHETLAVSAALMLHGFCSRAELAQDDQVVKVFKNELRVGDQENEIHLRGLDGRAAVELVEF